MGAHFSSLAEAADANNLAAVESFLATCDANEKDPVRHLTLIHMAQLYHEPKNIASMNMTMCIALLAGRHALHSLLRYYLRVLHAPCRMAGLRSILQPGKGIRTLCAACWTTGQSSMCRQRCAHAQDIYHRSLPLVVKAMRPVAAVAG